jgi:two-component system cell cycle response regulator
MDIDKFKQYNDCYGHQAGDHLLKNMAVALSSELRNFDVFARYGGEEFVVILPETDLNAAAAVAERMRATMETLHSAPPLEDYPIPAHRVTISLGVSTLCAQTPDGPAMISEADTALYYAKDTGRNRVVVLPCPEALG